MQPAGFPPLRTQDFDYHLPEDLIAQTPVEPRDSSRLLVLDRRKGSISHRRFSELDTLLGPKDLLVFNDSRVIPARLHGKKAGSEGAVEVVLLHRTAPLTWQCLVRPGRRVAPGAWVEFEGGGHMYRAEVLDRLEGGTRSIWFEDEAAIEACGVMPLPPYIHEPLRDAERYQTVYAKVAGSAAAPTAGLHFTLELLERLSNATAGFAFVTLHVGLDTFRPVHEDNPREHVIHKEFAILPVETALKIAEVRASGGRIVCVGTTTARVLETAAQGTGEVRPYAGWTGLFILPGYRFQAIDALITNFHLPRSSLLMLVNAFAGKGNFDRAYAEAISQRYRFYSFGDAMLVL